MEGLTGAAFRRLHAASFPGVDRYYTPFLSANSNLNFTSREKRDVDPAENEGIPLVPQVMCSQADAFLWSLKWFRDKGYRKVNLNLGCPAAQVVSRGRGAGFLRDPELLDRFFETVFGKIQTGADTLSQGGAVTHIAPGELSDVSVSVKTRLGVHSVAEAPALLAVYNRYPLSEVTVHARVLKQQYAGTPDPDAFEAFLSGSTHKTVYNGDIFTPADYQRFAARFPEEKYPQLSGVMIGRGLLANPALVRELRGGTDADKLTLPELKHWLRAVEDSYRDKFGGQEKLVLSKMKEIWFYVQNDFTDPESYLKPMRRASHLSEFEAAANNLMLHCKLKEER